MDPLGLYTLQTNIEPTKSCCLRNLLLGDLLLVETPTCGALSSVAGRNLIYQKRGTRGSLLLNTGDLAPRHMLEGWAMASGYGHVRAPDAQAGAGVSSGAISRGVDSISHQN